MGNNLKKPMKTNKTLILITVGVLVFAGLFLGPKNVGTGNGYTYKIGSFGQCDQQLSNCEGNAKHRISHLVILNEDYCPSCWDRVGKDMFEQLSGTNTKSLYYEDITKCRVSGCRARAEYVDEDLRYCSQHMRETRSCKYPGCRIEVPIRGLSEYCSEH